MVRLRQWTLLKFLFVWRWFAGAKFVIFCLRPFLTLFVYVISLCFVTGKVYSVISRRHGNVLEAVGMDEEERSFMVKAEVPVLFSDGFATDIRKTTSGHADVALEFGGYRVSFRNKSKNKVGFTIARNVSTKETVVYLMHKQSKASKKLLVNKTAMHHWSMTWFFLPFEYRLGLIPIHGSITKICFLYVRDCFFISFWTVPFNQLRTWQIFFSNLRHCAGTWLNDPSSVLWSNKKLRTV